MPPKPKNTSLTRVTKSKIKGDQGTSVPALRKSLRSQSKFLSTSTATTETHNTPIPASDHVTMPSNAEKAISLEEEKEDSKPVYFWRPNGGNGYLGQWFWSEFTVDGDTYATAEMWMMVQKARLFRDEAIAKKMLATTDPKTHKGLGRKVKNFDGKKWDDGKHSSYFISNEKRL